MEDVRGEHKPLDVLILAAGLGTRMRSNTAKVLHRLDGRPLINHVCRTAAALAPGKIYIVIGHQAEEVKQAVLAETDEEQVVFVLQKEQRGTGDAVNAAREYFADRDSRLLVLSGDVPIIRPETLAALVQHHRSHRGRGAACTMLTVKLKDPTGYGRIVRGPEGLFERIVEQKDATDEQRQIIEINAGIYCFETRKLFVALSNVKANNVQGEYYLTDVPGLLREAGEDVAIYQHHDAQEVEGINNRVQLAELERILNRRTVTKLMLDYGVTFVDPKSVHISEQALVGRDTVIHPNVTIEGATSIGDGCTIRSCTRITNSRIGHGVEVRDHCVIVESEIGNGCTLGPFAHLREQAVLEENARVGNYVEVKKSKLGRGVKASHLTYLGDAAIGENTNVGAGTVTCNYDGKNKHRTEIGANVRIGSDTMLVAPVKVGDRSVTAAGSVVIEDVPEDSLVAGVPAKLKKRLGADHEPEGPRETARQNNKPTRNSPEQITPEESLARMNSFAERREEFIASIRKSKD